jgi:hypothetical protein
MKKITWSNEKSRTKLPKAIDPNEKINFLSVIKDNIGKDLSKITMPGKLKKKYLNLKKKKKKYRNQNIF